MATSLERDADARERALADKVRAQATTMASATASTIEASDGGAVTRDVELRGVARVNGVMRAETAAAMEAYVDETLEALRAANASGEGRNLSTESFGNVYCKKNRWDMKLAYDAPVRAALRECVTSMGDALTAICGADARLVELAALVSDPGSTRQPVHPDTAYRRDPSVFTCFVALQDVERDMGPTLFIPGTNNARAHVEFREGDEREGRCFVDRTSSASSLAAMRLCLIAERYTAGRKTIARDDECCFTFRFNERTATIQTPRLARLEPSCVTSTRSQIYWLEIVMMILYTFTSTTTTNPWTPCVPP